MFSFSPFVSQLDCFMFMIISTLSLDHFSRSFSILQQPQSVLKQHIFLYFNRHFKVSKSLCHVSACRFYLALSLSHLLPLSTATFYNVLLYCLWQASELKENPLTWANDGSAYEVTPVLKVEVKDKQGQAKKLNNITVKVIIKSVLFIFIARCRIFDFIYKIQWS